MISYINKKDLNIEKYDLCIENSVQSRIYAFSWYLDIVADNWDVLVLNDYEAVMPIPWKKKFGLKYITQPYFCQQLGIFSLEEISDEEQKLFIKKIPKKYVKVSLSLNFCNSISPENQFLQNFTLNLAESQPILFKNFSKGRKHAVKVGEKQQLILQNITINSLIDIQKNEYQYSFSEFILQQLAAHCIAEKKGEIIGVFKEDVLLGGAFFIYSKKRIIYLFSAFTELGKELQASSFLINSIIKKNENSNLHIDFEGGNTPNMATFYKSFGAEIENYPLIYYYNFPLMNRILNF